MNRLKAKFCPKIVGGVLLLAVLVMCYGIIFKQQTRVSDWLFLAGLALVCLAVIDILLHAHLLAGWFQKQRKGESDEEFAKRKIDVHRVGSLKNKPIHFEKLAFNSLLLGLCLIVLAVLITL
jgi:hypothetical protein